MLEAIREMPIAHENHSETDFTPTRVAVVHKPVTSTDDDTEKSKPSYTAGGNIKQCSHFRKLSGVPQMIKY